MLINDIWCRISIEPKYEKIINSKEFNDMKNKTQLGLNCNSSAIHTRYQHSIGTYYLACRLVEICKKKFSRILTITQEDEEAIKCMALVHDIGHGCFSHVSEKHLKGTHENRTVNILLDEKTEIHQAIISSFGPKVLDKIVNLIKMKEQIKGKKTINNETGLMLIIGKLLSGGIDIDRIDYIFRDSKYVANETNDYSSILESIDLENIGDTLEVVFSSDAEYAIANFFNKRFELYDSLYLNNETRILESIFGKFLQRIGLKLSWDTTEIEMSNIFREALSSSDIIIRRYASMLSVRKLDENILVKEINDKNSFIFYRSKLLSKVPELQKYSACLFESECSISIYNENNKIFINKLGLIQDLSDCTKILNPNLTKEKYIIAIDLLLLRRLLELDNVREDEIDEIIRKVRNATAVEIEQERKYTFSSSSKCPKKEFKIIKEEFNLGLAEYIENYDTYYDYDGILESFRIAVRKRVSDGKVEWTVKKPLTDKSSISKREERNFNSLDEVILFLQNEWKLPIKTLEEVISLKTLRAKYDLEYYDGLFEIVFDKTTPIIGEQEIPSTYMIECELKSGNSCGLYFINELISGHEFIEECKFSKKEIALAKARAIFPTIDMSSEMKRILSIKKEDNIN